MNKKVATSCFSPPEYHLEEEPSKKEKHNFGELHLSWTLGLLFWHMLSGEQKTIQSLYDIKQFELNISSNIKDLQGSETFYLVIKLLALNPAKRMKFWSLHKILGKSTYSFCIPLPSPLLQSHFSGNSKAFKHSQGES